MNPPIFDQQLVASVDEDGNRSCTASTPGPAGVAELNLGNGAVISVDYVEPDQLVSIEFAPSTRRSVLTALIGAGRASELLALRFSPDITARRLGVPPEDDMQSLRAMRGSNYAARQLGQLALLNTVSRDDRSPYLTRAVASLELAHTIAGGDLDHVPGLRRMLQPAVRATADLFIVAQPDLGDFVERDPRLAGRVAQLCREVAPNNRTLAAVARFISDRIVERDDDDGLAGWHNMGVARQAMIVNSPNFYPRGEVDRFELLSPPLRSVAHAAAPRRLRPVADYQVELLGGGRLFVHFHRPATGEWVRVIDARTLVLLALAPVRSYDGDQTAEAIVPTNLAADDLRIEITDTPFPVSASALARAQQAIRLARNAADLSITGAASAAGELWRASAAIWSEIGDDMRAALADRLGSGKPRLRRSVTLADQVAASERRANR